MFAWFTLQHEQTFGVNRFSERLFAGHVTTIKRGCDTSAPGSCHTPFVGFSVVSATLSIEAAPPSEAAQLATIEQAVRLMRDVVRRPIPVGLSGASARRYVTLFSEAERVAASGVALFTPKVVETGEHTKEGHGSAAEWLGKLSGSSSGAAKGRLAAASRAAKDPLLTEALHEGELSSAQLRW